MRELVLLALRAVRAHRLRSALSMVGIAIGIAAVILLTSLGEGARRYIVDQFSQFGTNVLAINPGKAETAGLPGMFGGTTQKLTLDDAEALMRVPGVVDVVPIALAMARVEGGGRGRSVFVYGCTPALSEVWRWKLRAGSYWPGNDPRRGPTMAVLGTDAEARAVRRRAGAGRFRQDRRHPLPGHRHHGAQGSDAGLRPR